MAFYIQSFTVTGEGAFPTDMLRYDSCYPALQEDVLKMEGRERRTVKLSRHVASKRAMPTMGRWASFQWHVNLISVQTR